MKAHEVLLKNRDGIIQSWMGICRQQIPPAANERDYILRDDIPDVIDDLHECLKENTQLANYTYAAVSGESHGKIRAQFTGFDLEQLIQEYRILRRLVFETLDRQNSGSQEERNIINEYLDYFISRAADAFKKEHDLKLQSKTRDAGIFLRNFASIAAHDLKSPLTTASGYIDLIREANDLSEEERRAYLERVDEIIRRASALLDQMLYFSQFDVKLDSDSGSFNAFEAVDAAQRNLDSVIQSTRTKILVRPLPEIKADLPLISNVFQNLIGNAIKFRGNQEPKIEISSKEESDKVTFIVADNGVGFSPEQDARIFELFVQGTEGRKQGVGIGLAMCKKIVEAHGGTIWAQSKPGSGSQFYFTIPKKRETKN